MDKMKEQLALVKQHSFWAMCLGILGVSLGSWWVSTSKLATESRSRKGATRPCGERPLPIQPPYPDAARDS